MKIDKIKEAKEEAKRFIIRCNSVINREKEEGNIVEYGCKETGALRRSSLDLTRVLAEMRK